MGPNKWTIFDDDGKALLSTIRKCKSHFHWILVQKLSSRLIIFLLGKACHYGSFFNCYCTFECGKVQNRIKKIICPYMGKAVPTSIYFLIDRFLDRSSHFAQVIYPNLAIPNLAPNWKKSIHCAWCINRFVAPKFWHNGNCAKICMENSHILCWMPSLLMCQTLLGTKIFC